MLLCSDGISPSRLLSIFTFSACFSHLYELLTLERFDCSNNEVMNDLTVTSFVDFSFNVLSEVILSA